MSDSTDPTDAPLWTYRARPDPGSDYTAGVVDGDTLELLVDTGFNGRHTVEGRLVEVDTAELHGADEGSEEYETAVKQRDFVKEWLTDGVADSAEWPLLIVTAEPEDAQGSFGRWLIDVYRREDGARLVDDILALWPEATYE